MHRLQSEWWLSDRGVIRVHARKQAVACAIVDELERIQQRTRIPVAFVIIQARNSDHDFVDPVVEHARNRSLAVLDISRDLQLELDRDASFAIADHLSPKGYAWVARRIEAFVKAERLLAE
jgi:hypothetical protein